MPKLTEIKRRGKALWRMVGMEPDQWSKCCNFCGANVDDPGVYKMIAGVNAMICNDCVELCNDLLSDD